MRLRIRVIPNAPKSEIISQDGDEWKIKIQAPPEDGKANGALVQLLAKHLKVPKNSIQIIAGKKSRQKIVEIFDLPNKNTLNK
ncbi:MAG: DUF167 domain-containing protein [Puniceicoccales bacterium]|jgi:uncharacterized protein (TIGR00251 family)|nr:DUF167 domain-containing protein [Puniceicoccales bacterium]